MARKPRPNRRAWTRAAQIAAEKPRYPHVPSWCPQCGCTRYTRDEDDDWLCFMCGRTLVVWSRYRYELRRWRAGNEARAEGYKRPEERAA